MTEQIYRNREDEVRASVSKEEAIKRIQKFGGDYDESNTDFDLYDQLLACEALSESTPNQTYTNKETINTNESVLVNGNGNDGCKQRVNFELTPTKLEAISKLKSFDFRTQPPEIASQLEVLFMECDTKTGWWLTVSQRWNPRAINRVIARIIKLHSSGQITLKNPAAYFTHLIQFRKKRRL